MALLPPSWWTRRHCWTDSEQRDIDVPADVPSKQRFLLSTAAGPLPSPELSLTAANVTWPHCLPTSHPASASTYQLLIPSLWVPLPLPDSPSSRDTVPYLWAYQNPLHSFRCHRKAPHSLSSQSYWARCCAGCRGQTGLCLSLSPMSCSQFILSPPNLSSHSFPLQQVGLHFIHSIHKCSLSIWSEGLDRDLDW